MNILGVHIERKTDVLAAAAFVLSLTGIIIQLGLFFEGPRVVRLPPEQILLWRNDAGYLALAAQSTYVNNSIGDHNAILQAERIYFELGDRKYEQRWQAFVELTSEGAELKQGDRKPAKPVVIEHRSAISHETVFAPRAIPIPGGEAEYTNFLNGTIFWRSWRASTSCASGL